MTKIYITLTETPSCNRLVLSLHQEVLNRWLIRVFEDSVKRTLNTKEEGWQRLIQRIMWQAWQGNREIALQWFFCKVNIVVWYTIRLSKIWLEYICINNGLCYHLSIIRKCLPSLHSNSSGVHRCVALETRLVYDLLFE